METKFKIWIRDERRICRICEFSFNLCCTYISASLFWEILPGHETTNKSIGFPFTNNGTTWQNLDLCLWIQLKYWPNSLVLTFRVEEVAKILKNFTKNVSKAKFISWNDLKYAINASKWKLLANILEIAKNVDLFSALLLLFLH